MLFFLITCFPSAGKAARLGAAQSLLRPAAAHAHAEVPGAPAAPRVSVPARGMGSLLSRLKLESPAQITLTPAESDKFKRWMLAPVAVATHISLGAVLAWSIFNEPLSHAIGVAAPGAADWTLAHTIPIFSASIASFGVTAAVLGYRGVFEKLGPRRALVLGSLAYASSYTLACTGLAMHNLPLIYLGYIHIFNQTIKVKEGGGGVAE